MAETHDEWHDRAHPGTVSMHQVTAADITVNHRLNHPDQPYCSVTIGNAGYLYPKGSFVTDQLVELRRIGEAIAEQAAVELADLERQGQLLGREDALTDADLETGF